MLCVLASVWCATVAAQDSASTPPPGSQRDSIYALRRAQTALKLFHVRFREWIDPDNGPPWIKPAGVLVCDKIVGVYCFGPRNGAVPFGKKLSAFPVEFKTSELSVPKFLRRVVNNEVMLLMRSLDSALSKSPGDRWLIGQKVFHLVEHGEIEKALDVARSCRSERWWCASLVGYTTYHLHRYLQSDSAFSVALASLPPDERCKRESVDDLLYGDSDREWYLTLSCADRVARNRTLWWLADPLYLTAGNERFTAHFYREVFRQLFMDSNNELPEYSRAQGARNNPRKLAGQMFEREVWDQVELPSLVRGLGVPTYFMIGGAGFESFVLLQYEQPTYHFFPRVAAVRDPMRATAESWNILDPQAIERYHPRFGIFASIDYQIAFFKRGDSARIVTAADLKKSPLTAIVGRRLITSALVLTRGPEDIRIFRDSIPGTNSTFLTRAPAESTIVSIEALASGVGAARARFASGPPPMPSQRVSMSDILLVGKPDSAARTLEIAARLALPTSTVPKGQPLGLYWEMYGLTRGDTLSYLLTATERRTSTLTNIGRFLGIRGAATGTSIRWTEQITTDEQLAPRALALDISTLTRGDHVLRLEVTVPGQNAVRVSRGITIAR